MAARATAQDRARQQKRRAFLEAYRTCGNISHACQMAGIARADHYRWLNDDPEYAEAFRAADEEAGDRLEREAWRRAVDGVEKPVYQSGKLVGTVREYSDTLLIFLLKGLRPEKYQERSRTEIASAGGQPLVVRIVTDEAGGER